ncbi:MAG: hypothetical protein AB9880_01005 [Christensenellales bacterium]
MKNWKYKISLWMQGRYGIDPLYKGLLAVYFGIFVLNMFLRSTLLSYAATLLVILSFFRVFSKQTAKRAEENRRYVALRDKVKKRVLQTVNRVREYKTHRYRACPSCHTTLRLQKKIGTMTVACPKCHSTFQLTIKR